MTQDDIALIEPAYDTAGDGAPVLLLHGFPQTRAMWRRVLPHLVPGYTCVTADLRGYGASPKPAADRPDTYSFRAMAADMAALMSGLGHDRFHLVGHDRGARVAYRLARDHPGRLLSLTLMDIVPTDHLLDTWSAEVGRAYYHWTFLAQPAPLPESMIAADPDAFYESCLLGWGSAELSQFPDLEAYRAAWRTPDAIRAMTADYRAVFDVDWPMDRAEGLRTLDLPSFVLYGEDGAMARLYDVPATWVPRLTSMTARAMPGGHFFVDQHPDDTGAALREFLDSVT
ncbi:alpha/beta fold hydrolase [Ovoidimarina sediminis]|uniref:alpha/beta fold hydrolase n=1 Tax=Ovoidimarina sediminis TaxID=3079856 RepID=UPI00290D575B|nr:alpha/beta hydrolase [Rhodophyticola sp. MJ-SS7]MDU8942011.1 alpha/beta hydrolase [Rhodophyticola sp. MJ-SS7]